MPRIACETQTQRELESNMIPCSCALSLLRIRSFLCSAQVLREKPTNTWQFVEKGGFFKAKARKLKFWFISVGFCFVNDRNSSHFYTAYTTWWNKQSYLLQPKCFPCLIDCPTTAVIHTFCNTNVILKIHIVFPIRNNICTLQLIVMNNNHRNSLPALQNIVC